MRATAALAAGAAAAALIGAGTAAAATPGSLVTGFGAGGTVTETFGGNASVTATPTSAGGGVAVAPNGDIYQVGSAQTDSPYSSSASELYIARYLPDGQLDTSFGQQGVTYVSLGTGPSEPTATPGFPILPAARVAIAPGGDPVVLTDTTVAGDTEFAVLEFNQQGALDTAFNQTGVYTTSAGSTYDLPGDLAVQSNGAIVFTGGVDSGTGQPELFAERLLSNGTVDQSFATDGVARLQLAQGSEGSIGTSVIAQSDGNLVFGALVFGTTGNIESVVTRLTTSGQRDPSFGTNGSAYADSSTKTPPFPVFPSVTATSDGGYAITGLSVTGTSATTFETTITRFGSDGSLDTSFGTDGTAVVPETFSWPVSLLAQADGKLVVSGFAATSALSTAGTLVARLNANGTLDSSFGTGGLAYVAPSVETVSIATDAALTPGGNIVVSGFSQPAGLSGVPASILQEFSLDTAPAASLTVTPSPAQAGTPVTLTANAVPAAGESISQVSWDFGTGSFGAATGSTVTHTFTQPGTYTVRAQVTDAFDLSTIATQTITVDAAPAAVTPTATVSVTPAARRARPELRLVWVHVYRGRVRIRLACRGAACNVTARLTTLERLLRGRVRGLQTAGHGRDMRTVTIAGGRYRLGKNRARVITLGLNGNGRRLLKLFHGIPARAILRLTNTRPARTIHRNIRIR